MYEEVSNDKAKDLHKLVENESKSVEEIMTCFEKIHDKIKFKSFGKTKISLTKPKCKVGTNEETESDEKKAKNLLKKQSEILLNEIGEIKEMKQGRSTKVFKLREKILGHKKQSQEACAVKDPKTEELIVSSEEIKKVSLEYCKEVLSNNKPETEYMKEIMIKEKIHDVRMKGNEEGKIKFGYGDCTKVLKKMKKNQKRTYDFLVRSGELFQKEVFNLCRRLIKDEKFPSSFDRTTLHQIYKGKGSREVLSNSRFIHCKEWLPRTCDFLVVDKMKPYIFKGTSKFQIGGMEKHRPQEHLFVVKSILGLFANLGKNIIFQLYDIQKIL